MVHGMLIEGSWNNFFSSFGGEMIRCRQKVQYSRTTVNLTPSALVQRVKITVPVKTGGEASYIHVYEKVHVVHSAAGSK